MRPGVEHTLSHIKEIRFILKLHRKALMWETDMSDL